MHRFSLLIAALLAAGSARDRAGGNVFIGDRDNDRIQKLIRSKQ